MERKVVSVNKHGKKRMKRIEIYQKRSDNEVTKEEI